MRKADKIKLSVLVGVSLLAFVVGCVDTSLQPLPTSIDYKSQISVVNLAVGVGTATVAVHPAVPDPDSLAVNVLTTKYSSSTVLNGTANFGATLPATGYQEVPAGGKEIIVSYTNATTDTFKLSTDTDYKMRLYIVGDTSAGGRSILKTTERYIWQTPGSTEGAPLFPAGSGWIKLFNGSPDAGDITDVQVTGGALDTTITLDAALSFMGSTDYLELDAGTYTFSIWSGTDSLGAVSQSIGSQKRYTTVMYSDTASGLQVKVLTDD